MYIQIIGYMYIFHYYNISTASIIVFTISIRIKILTGICISKIRSQIINEMLPKIHRLSRVYVHAYIFVNITIFVKSVIFKIHFYH